MANLNVTYGDMLDAARNLTQGEADIKSRLDHLRRMVQSLVSGGYVTDASSKAFESSYTEFDNGAKQTISGLEGIATYLNKAAEALRQVDNDLANSLKK